MIIHELIIENINNYKGKFTFSFDKLFHSEKLLALTGKTGSGKSTVLSSITLALYGKGINSKKLTAFDYLSRGEFNGKSSLKFSFKGEMYQSTFEIKRPKSRNQNRLYQNKTISKRSLKNLEKNQTLDFKTEDLLKIDYDHFIKTCFLPQNQFSNFIHATFRNRRDILEKLWKLDSLEGFGPFVHSKVKLAKKDLQFIDELLQNYKEDYQKNIAHLKMQNKRMANKKTLTGQAIEFYQSLLNEVIKVQNNPSLENLKKSILHESQDYQYKREAYQKELDSLKENHLLFKNNSNKLKNLTEQRKSYYVILNKIEQKLESFFKSEEKITIYNSRLKELKSHLDKRTSHNPTILKLKINQLDKLEASLTKIHRAFLKTNKRPLPPVRPNFRLDSAQVLETSEIEQYIFEKRDLEKKIEFMQGVNLNIKSSFNKSSFNNHDEILKSLDNAQSAKENKEKLQYYLQSLEKLKALIEYYSKNQSTGLIQDLKQSLKSINQAINQSEKIKNEKIKYQSLVKEYKRSSALYEESISAINSLLKDLNKYYPDISFSNFKSSEDTSLFLNLLSIVRNLKEEEGSLQKNIEAAKDEYSRIDKATLLKKRDMIKLSISGLDDTIDRLIKKSVDLKTKIDRIKTLSDQKINELSQIEKNLHQLKESYLIIKTTHFLYGQLTGYNHPQAKYLDLIGKKQNISDYSIQSIEVILEKYKIVRSNNENRMGVNQQKISELVREQEKRNQLLEKRKKILKSIGKYWKVFEIIGVEDFRNFCLAERERKLISYTNRELGHLTNHRYQVYQLNHSKNKSSELFIKDYHLPPTHQLRPIHTLSGGETFIVSLAFSLGLSEISRGQFKTNHFFIDEGFGQLDSESLNHVYKLLYKLSTTQSKKILIISHIENFTRKFSNQFSIDSLQNKHATYFNHHL